MSTKQIIQERLDQLNNIQKYTSNIRKDITFILQSLGWDSEHISVQDAKKIQCPFDKSHAINESKIDDHVAKCQSRKNYYADDLPLPDNSNTDPATSIFIDSSLVSSVIEDAKRMDANFQSNAPNSFLEPHEIVTASQMVCNYTRDERRAIYDHLVTRAPSTHIPLESLSSSQMQEPTSNKSHLEGLAQSRDLKRRRMKYKVSTKSKSYTDVMREVIENQMLSLIPTSNTTNPEPCTNTKYGGHEENEREFRSGSQYLKRTHNKYEEDDSKNRNSYYGDNNLIDGKYGRCNKKRDKMNMSHDFVSSKRKKSNNKEYYN